MKVISETNLHTKLEIYLVAVALQSVSMVE